MSRHLRSRSPWLWSAGAAAILVLILTGARRGSSADPTPNEARVPAAQQNPQEPVRYQGDAPAPLAESAMTLARGTPEELMATVLAARGRRDLAALARCCSTAVGRDALDRLDAIRAERDFYESAEQIWASLQRALDAAQLRVETAPVPAVVPVANRANVATARGMVVFASGGVALPEFSLAIVQHNGLWSLEVAL